MTKINKQTAPGSETSLHRDLLATKDFVYGPANFQCSQPIKAAESAEYGAHTFQLNSFSIIFRVAKITPTKTGQFVTLWKRSANGPIIPFICVRTTKHFGQFIFPKSVLCQHDIVSNKNQGGKRAIRVYPPWEKVLNRQAQKTQDWQLAYFLEISEGGIIDCNRVRKLYSL